MTTSSGRSRRARAGAVVLAVCVGGLLSAHFAPALADSAGYAGPGPVSACRAPGPLGDPLPPVDLPGFGIGGTCFGVPAGATSVALAVSDDVSTTPPAFIVDAHVPGQTLNVGTTTFCGSGTWAIPPGGDELVIRFVDPVTSGCTGSGVATKGTVTATFN